MTLGYFVHQNIQGLEFPEVRLASYQKPGEYGAFVSNQLYGSRLVTLEGSIFGTSASDFSQKRRDLQNALQVEKDENSVPVAKTLYFTTMDDLDLQVTCYIRKLQMTMGTPTYAPFYIELFCPDFGIEDQTLSSATLTPPSGGGATLPFILPITLGAATGGTQIVTNGGTTNAYPTITLTGVLTDPVITNTTTGRYMSLDATILTGETAVIDMANKTILLGTTPMISAKNLASDWWWLAPGSNQLTVQTGSVSDTGTVLVEYRDNYIGV